MFQKSRSFNNVVGELQLEWIDNEIRSYAFVTHDIIETARLFNNRDKNFELSTTEMVFAIFLKTW